jgi:hypothetical protein
MNAEIALQATAKSRNLYASRQIPLKRKKDETLLIQMDPGILVKLIAKQIFNANFTSNP